VSALRPLVGIFVGGRGLRMGGIAKGLLPAPDGSGALVSRLARMCEGLGLEVVLVGEHPAYTALGRRTLADAAPDAGPVGGLVALLSDAGDRPVVALSCDLPHVEEGFVRRLVDAPPAPIVAPRRAGRWEPLAARYAPSEVLPIARARLAARELALQGLLEAAGAVELPAAPGDDRVLFDWDTPEDRRRSE
jgi:molybdopterin-guanine dinucleotide biosynthesis protein A